MQHWQRWQGGGRREGDEVLAAQELSQIYWLNKEIAMWQKELERLENQSMAKAPELSAVVQHGSRARSKVENLALNPEMLMEEILALKEKSEQELSNIRQYIKEIDDSLVRQIRIRESWEKFPDMMGK